MNALGKTENLVQAFISTGGPNCQDAIYNMSKLKTGEQAFVNLPGKDPTEENGQAF